MLSPFVIFLELSKCLCIWRYVGIWDLEPRSWPGPPLWWMVTLFWNETQMVKNETWGWSLGQSSAEPSISMGALVADLLGFICSMPSTP